MPQKSVIDDSLSASIMSPSFTERPGTDTKSNISRIIASRGTFTLDGVEIGVDDSVDLGSLADRLKRTTKDLAIFKDSVSDMLIKP